MKSIKMICVDLDGTLFSAPCQISAENMEALRQCVRRGIRVYLVTGRPYCFSHYYAKMISEKVGSICAGGACIEDAGELVIREIRPKALKQLVDVLAQSDAKAYLKGLTDFYTHEDYDERFLYQHKKELFTDGIRLRTVTGLSYPELREQAEGILKVLIYEEDKAALERLRGRIKAIEGLYACGCNEISLDITASGVDKGSGIRLVRARHGISKEETLAMGDSYNDLPMFEACGFRIAMGNAPKEIMDSADAVTGTNRENGVAQAVLKYVLT